MLSAKLKEYYQVDADINVLIYLSTYHFYALFECYFRNQFAAGVPSMLLECWFIQLQMCLIMYTLANYA